MNSNEFKAYNATIGNDSAISKVGSDVEVNEDEDVLFALCEGWVVAKACHFAAEMQRKQD